jgi:hypothetical protein
MIEERGNCVDGSSMMGNINLLFLLDLFNELLILSGYHQFFTATWITKEFETNPDLYRALTSDLITYQMVLSR